MVSHHAIAAPLVLLATLFFRPLILPSSWYPAVFQPLNKEQTLPDVPKPLSCHCPAAPLPTCPIPEPCPSLPAAHEECSCHDRLPDSLDHVAAAVAAAGGVFNSSSEYAVKARVLSWGLRRLRDEVSSLKHEASEREAERLCLAQQLKDALTRTVELARDAEEQRAAAHAAKDAQAKAETNLQATQDLLKTEAHRTVELAAKLEEARVGREVAEAGQVAAERAASMWEGLATERGVRLNETSAALDVERRSGAEERERSEQALDRLAAQLQVSERARAELQTQLERLLNDPARKRVVELEAEVVEQRAEIATQISLKELAELSLKAEAAEKVRLHQAREEDAATILELRRQLHEARASKDKVEEALQAGQAELSRCKGRVDESAARAQELKTQVVDVTERKRKVEEELSATAAALREQEELRRVLEEVLSSDVSIPAESGTAAGPMCSLPTQSA
mmetsp:Transcript_8999/g.19323  ORF Transcript_8999/g.19323 Transcript_8999/m.19323 type:complete len:454 (+) Transcript_8999:313-1674(+)|eukprot:CAMPEP_0202911054 /NCGR_PEP_ID=MMETSP1392-20130828/53904_1 /ASSEMBLY_ACC=CAM_ASM_000868 /TAXON_ID=225041 /ORGANISM="Chlamydomonas chlamydogama, Strain SAG 11-48b" /LENGTH=453 /DNA_ID=CAMNT_0049601431 /DNA_START=231 /DNA_END=1592 /DNA_ORIENTATION=+